MIAVLPFRSLQEAQEPTPKKRRIEEQPTVDVPLSEPVPRLNSWLLQVEKEVFKYVHLRRPAFNPLPVEVLLPLFTSAYHCSDRIS